MAVSLSALAGAGFQFFDNNGNILSGGKLYSYAAGTTTPLATYTSNSGATPNANPIILDASGRTPSEIWLTNGSTYKFVLNTSTDALIGTWDNIPGINDPSSVDSALNAFIADLANTSNTAKGDALVGFRQSNSAGLLTNSVAGTVHTKLQESVSVKDFGAVGDGATDDTVAIQNAISYVSTTPTTGNAGRELFFPPGVYKTTATISATLLSGINCTIRGGGLRNSVIRLANGGASSAFDLTSTIAQVATWSFQDMGFKVDGAQVCVRMQNANGVTFTNCSFGGEGITSFASSGVSLNDSYANKFYNCYFRDFGANGLTTLVTGTNGLTIDGCVFQDCAIGISLLVRGNNIVVRDTDMEGCNLPIGITNYTSVLINGNYIEGGNNVRIYFGGSNYEVDITQNWFGDAGGTATPINNVIGGSFTGNTIYSSAWTVSTTTVRDFMFGHNYVSTGGPHGPSSVPSTFWTAPTLLNGFANVGGNYQVAGYIKERDGFVNLRGRLSGGAPDTLIFTLPVGYRPYLNEVFATASPGSPGTTIVEVRANGDVYCLSREGYGETGLSGVRFSVGAYTA